MMTLILLNKGDQVKAIETEGQCPKCGEWTEAQESCCGYGAIVEGSVMGEDQARELLGIEDEEN